MTGTVPDSSVPSAEPDGSARHGPAGIVTRVLAAAVDVAVVAAMLAGMYVGVAALSFAWSPASFSWPSPPVQLSGVLTVLVATGYLAIGWATIGRTYGGALLGLRVLSSRRSLLGWPRATLRAVLCVQLPIGLLWAAVSRRRLSLQDIVVRSVVVYDWNRDGGRRVTRGEP